jgi:thiamine-monophosphate kinase
LIRGIGDDAAVLRLPRGHEILVTTDFSLEDIHFRRHWAAATSIGHRTLLRGLSDIAAMGGIPLAAFLSLAVPRNLPQPWIDGFLTGLVRLATRFGVSLAGGDTSQSPEKVLADIVVVGSVPRGRAVLRSGARVGDRIYVTGQLGAAAARLARLYSARQTRIGRPRAGGLPLPRVAIGQFLRHKRIARSMIDLSDGLSTDLSHICEESKVGAEISEQSIPRARLDHTRVGMKFALHGGDDYELLFTADPRTRVPPTIGGTSITQIGEIKRARKLILCDAEGRRVELQPEGWEHFG